MLQSTVAVFHKLSTVNIFIAFFLSFAQEGRNRLLIYLKFCFYINNFTGCRLNLVCVKKEVLYFIYAGPDYTLDAIDAVGAVIGSVTAMALLLEVVSLIICCVLYHQKKCIKTPVAFVETVDLTHLQRL